MAMQCPTDSIGYYSALCPLCHEYIKFDRCEKGSERSKAQWRAHFMKDCQVAKERRKMYKIQRDCEDLGITNEEYMKRKERNEKKSQKYQNYLLILERRKRKEERLIGKKFEYSLAKEV